MSHPVPSLDIARSDRNRRRLFFTLCVLFGLPIIIAFSITDYVEGDIAELVLDGVIGAILVACFIGLYKLDVDLSIYRVGLALLAVSLLWEVAIGAGEGTVLYWLYGVPLLLFFFLGKLEGMLGVSGFLGILAILLINPFQLQIYTYNLPVSIRFLASFLFVSILAYGLELSRQWFSDLLTTEHNKLLLEKKQLEEAMHKIKILRGLLPICANCKKIRDDRGYWQQVEVYLSQHAEVEFSHGICPECKAKLYPEIYGDDL